MAQIISIHSFRRGTGKSSIAANVSTLLALQGLRIGVIDASIQAPAMQILFGLDEAKIKYSLNDYLWGHCQLEQTVQDVTNHLYPGQEITGQVFLVPSSSKLKDITHVLHNGVEIDRLQKSFYSLIELLNLDILLIDTYAGLSDTTMLSMAVSDTIALILRLDQQNYHGTGIMVDLAREFDVNRILMVVNEVPFFFDFADIREQISASYKCPVAAVLPYADEMMALGSTGIFALHYPEHTITTAFKAIANVLVK